MIIAAEAACTFADLLSSGKVRALVQQEEGDWPNTFRKGATIPAADYLRAMQLRTQLMREMHDAMNGIDLYLTIPYSGPTVAFTNLTGHPSLVTRCGMAAGRPLLIEMIAQPYREDAALRLAFEYERKTSWTKFWPAV
jgi:Asp-tRNA(Asn)/Glu-tRNA(Gln) amidotransferase A subunit family amidase